MSGNDKTLAETVAAATREQETATPPAETVKPEGISAKEASAETEAGETAEYVSGIDISDVPEQIRPLLKGKLEEKAKLLEKGVNVKFQEAARERQEVAALKKVQDELSALGLTPEEVREVLIKHLEGKNKTSTSSDKKASTKTLDNIMSQLKPYYDDNGNYVDPKAQWQQLRQIILEETDNEALRGEINQLKDIIRKVSGETTLTKTSRAEVYINGLTEKVGKELIEKYSDEMKNAHLKHNIPLERVLQSVVPFDELEQAILLKGKKPLTKEKRDAISNATGGVTTSAETIDIKKTSLAGVIRQIIRK